MLNDVSQLCKVDPNLVNKMASELSNASLPWSVNYSEYHTSGWRSVSLYNQSGDPLVNDLVDCKPIPTSALQSLPTIGEYLKDCPFRLMWARLLKMESRTFLWEHTDYGDLEDVERIRLHLPIVTNPQAFLVFDKERIHLRRDFIWKLNAKDAVHGACNLGIEPRTHLILDCYVDDKLRHLLQREFLEAEFVQPLKALRENDFRQLSDTAKELLRAKKQEEAEQLFLKAFHSFYLNGLSSYDLLVRFYEEIRDKARRDHWEQQKTMFLNLSKRR